LSGIDFAQCDPAAQESAANYLARLRFKTATHADVEFLSRAAVGAANRVVPSLWSRHKFRRGVLARGLALRLAKPLESSVNLV
jgi:hypothetical protein